MREEQSQQDVRDCVIIGGGPAGLTAATYLGRFRRHVTVIDAGESRLHRIPRTRNVPGFPDGIEGSVLHARMRRQAERYGAGFIADRTTQISLVGGGFIVVGAKELRCRTVLLATGVAMVEPAIDGLEEAVKRGVVRYCPVCDGFEALDRKIAVLGGRPKSIHEAFFLRTYSGDVTYLPAHAEFGLSIDDANLAASKGIQVERRLAEEIVTTEDGVRISYASGDTATFDVLYPCLGVTPRAELCSPLGVVLSEGGGILTDRHQETAVRGVFAAGDVVEGLDQIASACGQAAVAATAIHNRLAELDA
jgi:thioredoxin reductase (NADPH)